MDGSTYLLWWKKYVVETKIWEGDSRYQAGKKQLAAYLKLEGATDGYYVVFDHRQDPESRVETEIIDNVKIWCYVIPVVQERPSNERTLDVWDLSDVKNFCTHKCQF